MEASPLGSDDSGIIPPAFHPDLQPPKLRHSIMELGRVLLESTSFEPSVVPTNQGRTADCREGWNPFTRRSRAVTRVPATLGMGVVR